ncbi:MAG: formylglycine-generating enzyme family protein, partial [Verrucomicrobia bacterium]|nr:formylglycine-generating enzyme family protein [Verrucomicrobiota bacterium]
SAFYIDKFEVTKAKWDSVYAWAVGNGYSFTNAGAGKAATHPVTTINWYDCVKWCNARSQMDGLTPVYFSDAGRTQPYKTTEIVPYVNWSASGYRLPTEAEWEKAARGGASGHRFPWADTDFVDFTRANYMSVWSGGAPLRPYDQAASSSYNPTYATGGTPYTGPSESFVPNGYGLYNMAGNVWEWCWDWYSATYYSTSPATNPQGAGTGTGRALRGGSWGTGADTIRCSHRIEYAPDSEVYRVGFRCVRGLHDRLAPPP